jgi:hypothetical protein
MLPDIDTPNKRFAVSGLGAYEGHGILSRSFEDLHPQPDRYEVVWNGSIEAQIQRAEQRVAPGIRLPYLVEKARPLQDDILEVVREAGKPVTVPQVVALSQLHYGIVEVTLRRLALRGELSVCDQLNEDRSAGKRKWMRVYALPLQRTEAA